jgi:hypothetical protein
MSAKLRSLKRREGNGRDAGAFIALPWCVLDSAAYANLSHPARALLLEIARQFVRDNNGKLLASRAYLAARGWRSADVIHRAKTELLAGGFVHETVKGHRPNKASWYAVTWLALDRLPGYDAGAMEMFKRSAYKNAVQNRAQNTVLSPSDGTGKPRVVPSDGTGNHRSVPPDAAIRGVFDPSSVPSDGHHLDKPSAVVQFQTAKVSQRGKTALNRA